MLNFQRVKHRKKYANILCYTVSIFILAFDFWENFKYYTQYKYYLVLSFYLVQ